MNQVTAQTHQLVVIDSQVNNYQSLVSAVGNDTTVLVLDSSSDGLTQISDYLATLPSKAFQSIHIISHGGVGSLLLGSGTVTGSNLGSYSKQLATLGNALTDTGDILLYGCNVAAGDSGRRFIEDLAGFTGADVAASDDLTGAAGLGGDWVLEAATGVVEASAIEGNIAGVLSIAFGTPVNIDATQSGGYMGVGDFNQDGRLDVMAASGGEIDWYERNPDGGYTKHIVGAGDSPHAMNVADVDGDGNLDLVVSHQGNNGRLAWFKNDGLGNFTSNTLWSASEVWANTVFDADGDGRMDIVAASKWDSNTYLFHQNADHTFTAQSIDGTTSRILAHADLNQDGHEDLLAGLYWATDAAYYLNNGTGSLSKTVLADTGGNRVHNILATDVNGDGALDVIIGQNPNFQTLYLNNGNMAFTAVDMLSQGQWDGFNMSHANIDGQTGEEFLLNSGNSIVWRKYDSTTSQFVGGVVADLGSVTPGSAAFVDYNGDGVMDVVTTSSGGVVLIPGVGVDTTAPTLSSSSPADNATAVVVNSNIALTFNESVQAGTGNIVISNGTDTRNIAVTDTSQVSISGTTVTINPAADLNSGSAYNVQMASGVIKDTAGNAYAGISDATTLNFTTAAPSAPTAGQAVIDLGAGYGKLILPVNVDGNWYYYWDRTGDGSSANTVGAGYSNGTDYTTHDVLDGIFKYASDFTTINPASGTNDTYRYATLNGVVKVALPTQGDGQTNISGYYYAPGTAIDNVPAGETNPIYNDLLAIWDAYNGTSTGTDTYGVPQGWHENDFYWSATPSASGYAGVDLFHGFVGNHYDHPVWVALEVLFADTTVPTLTSSTPTDNATAVAVGSNIALTFNETVQAGTGNIVISNGTDTRTIAVTDSSQITISGSTVTINPAADLALGSTYNVQMASGVIKDVAGNTYAGINNTTTLNFTTINNVAPTLTTFSSAVASGNEDSVVTVTLANLQSQGNEADADGTVTAFVIKAVNSGTLKIGLTAATAIAWNATTNNTVDATHQAYWIPSANANGTVNAFTAVAKDNGGLESTTPISASINIGALPDVNVTAGVTPTEGGTAGTFTVTLDSPAPVGGLTVNYSLAGTATLSTDYTVTAGSNVTAVTGSSFTVAAGQTSATLNVNAVGDAVFDANETVALTLASGGGYQLGATSFSSFSPLANVEIGTGPIKLFSADFNGDGKLDLAVTNHLSNDVSIRLGDGSGGFSGTTTIPVGIHPGPVIGADFNGDGKLDLAVANRDSNNVSIHLGDGIGGFSGATTVSVGTSPWGIVSADFNGDGKLDLASANYSTNNNVSVRLGDGSGGFSGTTTIPVGSYPAQVIGADFNGDGKLDLAVVNEYSSNVSICLGDGSGNFSGTTTVSVGNGPTVLISADFNGDGKLDLATANHASNDVSVRLGDGSGGFSGTTAVSVGDNPWSFISADFNGDGKLDLAAANYNSNNVSVRLGDGSGGFSGTTTVSVGNEPYSVTSGDFNGDGKLDLAVANYASNNVSVLLNTANPSATLTISDNPAPTLTSSTPADNATAVAVGNNITLTFSEAVQAGTGNIIISSDTDTRTISITDTSQVTINGSTVTINPTLDLIAGGNYNVQIAAGVIKDLAGNAYSGISNTSTLNFTTLDTQAPTLLSSTPTDNATAVPVGNSIVLTFNESVKAETGNIIISNGTDTRTISVTDTSQVTINGSTVTINPIMDLIPGGSYNVQMASGVIKDLAGNAYSGISNTSTLNFTTLDSQAPTLLSSTPTDNATAVAVGNSIVLTFNESVKSETGNIIISNGTDTRTISITDTSQVTINGNTVTINPIMDLIPGGNYNVQMLSGVIKDLAGNAYAGISDATTFNFTTLDTQAPTLISSTPADNTTAVAVGSNIVLTFNEAVKPGAGNIVISNGTDIRAITITDPSQIAINGSTVTINPALDLIAGGSYHVQLASGVIKDLAGNTYAGIGDATTLNFTTLDTQAPTLLSSTPTDNATLVAVGNSIVLTFNEAVKANTGNIVISNDTDARTISITDPSQVIINTNTVTINPTLDLIAGSSYNVQMASGVIKDLAGNAYAGITDVTTLNFTTTAAPNTAPTATNLNQTLPYAEDTTAAIADIVITDPNINTFTATVSLADGNSTIGSLTAGSGNGETFNTTTGVWTITGTKSAVNTALAAMSFVPVANGHLNTSALVSISDGIAPAISGTLIFNGTAVNDAPTGTDSITTTLEDTPLVFNATHFGFTDSNDKPANSLAKVLITSLPTAGSLQLNGIAVTANQVISVANINSKLLKFIPAANANGNNYANFNFKVQDNGGTVNNGIDTSTTANTVTINVTAVNDLPTGNITITGTPTQGQTLTASDNLADVDGLGLMSYTWKTGATVLGTGKTYTLAATDLGKTITVTASYTDLQGTLESKSSLATATISPLSTPAFIITKNDLITGEDGDTAIIGVKLATAPTQNVSVTFTSDDFTEGTVTHPTLTFSPSNWQTAQNFTVVGQNDYLRDGNQIISINAVINSNDVDYRQILIDPIGITNKEDVTTDNDARIPLGTVRDMPLKIYGDAIVDTSIIDAATGLFKVTGTLNVNDHLHGLDGNDKLYGENFQDELSGGIGNDTLYGGNDEDFLYGQDGNDYLWGEQDADNLEGGTGNDTLDGGSGLDTLIGGTGNDTYYLGYDAVDFIDDQGLATDVDIVIMPYQLTSYALPSSIENGAIAAGTATSSLTGNSSNNTLTGNDGKNSLDGAVGRDSLFGGAGNDALLGGEDNDSLDGGVGADHLEGGSGNDSVDGGAGNDEFIGGSGAGDDIYIGDLGIDTLKYTSAITGIKVDLALGTASGNEINNDTLSDIENIIGGQAGDLLNGSVGKNALGGYFGNDTITGGAGKDLLTGGLGADRFTFNSETETGITVAARDVISDFKHTQGDKIDLSGIDANKATADNDAFSIFTAGGAFSGSFTSPGKLYFDQTAHILYGNNDADSAADFSIQLTGVNSLVGTDIVL